MTPVTNHLGQPVGAPLTGWDVPPVPGGQVLAGNYARLEPLDVDNHGLGLWRALETAPDTLWTYMTFGPFQGENELMATLNEMVHADDWVPYAILVDGTPLGFASFLRVNSADGVIEIGAITFSPALQRTTAATEAIYLMIQHLFDLGYRRCEWKCDDLNETSRRAALRLGFRYEGTFRKATHYKGRNRDTAWYAIVDNEWETVGGAIESWLSKDNFDEAGNQISTLWEQRE